MKTNKLILGSLFALSMYTNPLSAQRVTGGGSCPNLGDELIANGDFSLGNNFFTNSYTYVNACASSINGNGTTIHTYDVQQITTCYSPVQDRLSGNGYVLHLPDIQGADVGWVFWAQTVNVAPNTTYYFSLWAYEPSGNCTNQPQGTNFDIYIGGALVQSDNIGNCQTWNNKIYSWYSGTNTSAVIQIKNGTGNYNLGTAGMDPIFDGLSFKACLATPPACPFQGAELITNGDFTGGNSGFTSSYTYFGSCAIGGIHGNGSIVNRYDVSPMTSCYAPLQDRLSGNGNVLHFPDIQGNGSQTNWVFWGQTVNVTANTNYILSMWVYEPTGNCQYQPQGTKFDVYMGSTMIQTDNIGGCGVWTNKIYYWNSGTNTSITIQVKNSAANFNQGLSGMDPVFDGFSFKQCQAHGKPLGIENIELSNEVEMTIAPNPSNGSTVLKSSADMEIRVTNELGQLVRTVSLNETNNHTQLVDNLNTGIYFINSYSGDNLIQKKLIITNK